MRLWPLVIALVVWTASLSASIAAETSSESLGGAPRQPASVTNSPPIGLSRPLFFGIMGEVTHPGTYAAQAVWTLTDLIKKAGGITAKADKAVRLYRGGVLTEQIFLGSGEAPALFPNDLIVVGSSETSAQRTTTFNSNQESTKPGAVSAVQVAFVNLIERPVVVKMPANHASLARIIEVLGQPAESAATIRVFVPPGAGLHDNNAIDEPSRALESGTVLVFAASTVHPESLPALPAAIDVTSVPAPVAAAPKPPEFKQTDSTLRDRQAAHPDTPQAADKLAVAGHDADHLAVVQVTRSLDITPHIETAATRLPLVQSPESIAAFQAPREPTSELHAELPRESHPGRMVALMAAMSAIAGLAMLLTIISIAQRWMASGKLPFRRPSWMTTKRSALPGSARGTVPQMHADLIRRPIRIDASQPITRLSVDLAVIERASRSKSVV